MFSVCYIGFFSCFLSIPLTVSLSLSLHIFLALLCVLIQSMPIDTDQIDCTLIQLIFTERDQNREGPKRNERSQNNEWNSRRSFFVLAPFGCEFDWKYQQKMFRFFHICEYFIICWKFNFTKTSFCEVKLRFFFGFPLQFFAEHAQNVTID